MLPNGVLAVNSSSGRSSLVTASRETLRFDQTERLFAVLRAGAAGRLSAEAGLRELRRIVQIPPPFGRRGDLAATASWPWVCAFGRIQA